MTYAESYTRQLSYASAAGTYDNLRIWDYARTSFPDMNTEAPLGWVGSYAVSQRHAQGHISVANGAGYVDHDTLTYALSSTFGPPDWFHYTVHIDYPASLTPVEVIQRYTPAESYVFVSNVENDPAGTLQVSLSLTGLSAVTDFTGDLFSVVFDGVSEDLAAEVEISDVVMRQRPNTPIEVMAGDADLLQVDGTEPVLDADFPTENCLNADFNVAVDLTDNLQVGAVEYRYDGGAWVMPVTELTGTHYAGTLALPIGSLGEGDHHVDVRGRDHVGYASSPAAGWDFHIDRIPPAPPTNLAASPRFHAVRLTWTAASGHEGYELWRVKRTPYPYYGGLPGEGSAYAWVADIPSGDLAYTDDFGGDAFADRGVYDYQLKSVDCVNATESATASATNYFLGDWAVPYDGGICSPDLARLAGCYGTVALELVTDEVDVAPTSDHLSFSLPGPDGRINFEDLIIFAMNYDGLCEPPLEGFPGVVKHPAEPLVDAATSLRLEPDGEGWMLVADGSLKGFSATLACDATLLDLDGNGALALSYRTAEGWVIDAVALQGSLAGDHAVRFRLNPHPATPPRLVRADGRDEANQPLPLTAVDTPALATPREFFLAQNQPNPFNPTTMIRFGLAEACPVRLSLYNALGQQVRVLADGPRAAGEHVVQLDAMDLASGVYFYRLESGSHDEWRKMLLLR